MVTRIAEPTPAELWARLEALPEHQKGEIIDGQLYVQARPRPRHARGIGYLGRILGGSFDYDEEGPGGWWIVPEPGIEIERAPEVSPDLAGWLPREARDLAARGRAVEDGARWGVRSPLGEQRSLRSTHEGAFYASVGVPWLWMVDTRSRLIEVRQLSQSKWLLEAIFSEERDARMPPFEAIAVPLHRLWV